MRISDWSSDVCSSDLRLCSREGLAIVGSPVGPREPESRARPAAASEGARESQSHALCRTARLHDGVAAKAVIPAAGARTAHPVLRPLAGSEACHLGRIGSGSPPMDDTRRSCEAKQGAHGPTI